MNRKEALAAQEAGLDFEMVSVGMGLNMETDWTIRRPVPWITVVEITRLKRGHDLSVVETTVLASGESECSLDDSFDRRLGRLIAKARAMRRFRAAVLDGTVKPVVYRKIKRVRP